MVKIFEHNVRFVNLAAVVAKTAKNDVLFEHANGVTKLSWVKETTYAELQRNLFRIIGILLMTLENTPEEKLASQLFF